jgi:hypothetical protein
MLDSQQVEDLIAAVASMDRQTIVDEMLDFRGPFPVDFTPQYLRGLSIDRLRHVYVALCMQTQQMPRILTAA